MNKSPGFDSLWCCRIDMVGLNFSQTESSLQMIVEQCCELLNDGIPSLGWNRSSMLCSDRDNFWQPMQVNKILSKILWVSKCLISSLTSIATKPPRPSPLSPSLAHIITYLSCYRSPVSLSPLHTVNESDQSAGHKLWNHTHGPRGARDATPAAPD